LEYYTPKAGILQDASGKRNKKCAPSQVKIPLESDWKIIGNNREKVGTKSTPACAILYMPAADPATAVRLKSPTLHVGKNQLLMLGKSNS